MTLSTRVRINYPVAAVRLLDAVTVAAGGDPQTVRRSYSAASCVTNDYGQNLLARAGVQWWERLDEGEAIGFTPNGHLVWSEPPALVELSLDTSYVGRKGQPGIMVHVYKILPAVVSWLDEEGVPRTSWWWEDDHHSTFHPGSVDVASLATDDPIETWSP